MARTLSTMLPLGTPAPAFALPDTRGKVVSIEDFLDRPLLVMFICNHCPFVKHIRSVLAAETAKYIDRGVAVVGINANDVATHPSDSPEHMAREAVAAGYRFPYLFDESQEVAKAYRAACTPDFFLFDRRHRLVYRGRFDGSSPGNDVPTTGDELGAAVDSLLAGRPIAAEQKASIGCNVKWKPGNEPDYF